MTRMLEIYDDALGRKVCYHPQEYLWFLLKNPKEQEKAFNRIKNQPFPFTLGENYKSERNSSKPNLITINRKNYRV